MDYATAGAATIKYAILIITQGLTTAGTPVPHFVLHFIFSHIKLLTPN
jgi:hypothetical protein